MAIAKHKLNMNTKKRIIPSNIVNHIAISVKTKKAQYLSPSPNPPEQSERCIIFLHNHLVTPGNYSVTPNRVTDPHVENHCITTLSQSMFNNCKHMKEMLGGHADTMHPSESLPLKRIKNK